MTVASALNPFGSAIALVNGLPATIVLASTHYPLLLDRLASLAPWPVEWNNPAPAIARRVADLLWPPVARAMWPARR
jgi:glutamate racemase